MFSNNVTQEGCILDDVLMYDDELVFHSYVKTLALHLPKRRTYSGADSIEYNIGQLLSKLERRDIFLSYELARYIVELGYEKYWMRLAMPVLVMNVKYVERLNGISPCEQQPEHHAWLESMLDNHPGDRRRTQKQLEQGIVRLSDFHIADDASLRYLNVLNIYREFSQSPMKPWWWFDFEIYRGPFVSKIDRDSYVRRVHAGMLRDLPCVLKCHSLMEYVPTLFTHVVALSEKKQPENQDTTEIAVVGNFTYGNIQQAVARARRVAHHTVYSTPNVQNVPRGLGKTSSVTGVAAGSIQVGKPVKITHHVASGGTVFEQISIDEVSMELQSLRAKFNSSRKDKAPRGRFAGIPGHNTVEPWKNKGKRGHIK